MDDISYSVDMDWDAGDIGEPVYVMHNVPGEWMITGTGTITVPNTGVIFVTVPGADTGDYVLVAAYHMTYKGTYLKMARIRAFDLIDVPNKEATN